MERMKQLGSYLFRTSPARTPKLWKELSAGGRAFVIFAFAGPPSLCLSALMLSQTILPGLHQYSKWITTVMAMDMWETAGIAALVASVAVCKPMSKAKRGSYLVGASFKLIFGWLFPLVVMLLHRAFQGKTMTNLPIDVWPMTLALDFVPCFRSELEGSDLLAVRVLFTNTTSMYILGLPFALLLAGMHRMWVYFRSTSSEASASLSVEGQELRLGEEKMEKMVDMEREPSEMGRMV